MTSNPRKYVASEHSRISVYGPSTYPKHQNFPSRNPKQLKPLENESGHRRSHIPS